MDPYRKAGELLYKYRIIFSIAVVVITILLAACIQLFPLGYDASGDPTGPAFTAREIIAEDFTQGYHAIPFIIEARGEDVLTQECLSELLTNEEVFRASDLYADYSYRGYSSDLGIPMTAIYTIADGVNSVLLGMFNTSIHDSTADMVKVALHYYMQSNPTSARQFSKDNHTTFETVINIGPIPFTNITVWHTKGIIAVVLLDYDKVYDNFTDPLDIEAINLDIADMIKGEEESYRFYGIAIDLFTEIEEEATTSVMLVFLAVIAILVIVFLNLRSVVNTVTIAIAIIALLVWLQGAVRLFHFGDSQYISLLLPISILALGVDYAIHSTHRYREEKGHEPDPKKAYINGLSHVGAALFIAMVTTAVAFFANATSELQSVGQFGIAAGVAIISAFILLGIFVPTIKMLLDTAVDKFKKRDEKYYKKKRKELANPKKEKKGIKHKLDKVEDKVSTVAWTPVAKMSKFAPIVLILVLLITVPLAWRGMQIEGKMPVEDFINPESDFVIGLNKMNDNFVGGEEGKVLVQGDFRDPALVQTLDNIHQSFADNEEARMTGYSYTIYDYLVDLTTNPNVFPMYGNTTLPNYLQLTDIDNNSLPDTMDQVERCYEFMLGQEQGVPLYFNGLYIVGYTYLEVNSVFHWEPGAKLDRALLSVAIPHSTETSKTAIGRQEVQDDLKPLDDMGFASNEVNDGNYYVITDVGNYNPFTRAEQMNALTSSMGASVFISVALCLIVLLVLFRSLKYAVVTMIPVCLVIAWLYGYMELTGYYLNAVTVTIAAISIGVGIDYSIHVTQRFREEFEKAKEFEPAILATLKSTGMALLGSAGSTIVGFVIIGFSPMSMFSKFGFLTAIMIGMSLAASVLVLPSLLALATKLKYDLDWDLVKRLLKKNQP